MPVHWMERIAGHEKIDGVGYTHSLYPFLYLLTQRTATIYHDLGLSYKLH